MSMATKTRPHADQIADATRLAHAEAILCRGTRYVHRDTDGVYQITPHRPLLAACWEVHPDGSVRELPGPLPRQDRVVVRSRNLTRRIP
jgi:hypothetical protein